MGEGEEEVGYKQEEARGKLYCEDELVKSSGDEFEKQLDAFKKVFGLYEDELKGSFTIKMFNDWLDKFDNLFDLTQTLWKAAENRRSDVKKKERILNFSIEQFSKILYFYIEQIKILSSHSVEGIPPNEVYNLFKAERFLTEEMLKKSYAAFQRLQKIKEIQISKNEYLVTSAIEMAILFFNRGDRDKADALSSYASETKNNGETLRRALERNRRSRILMEMEKLSPIVELLLLSIENNIDKLGTGLSTDEFFSDLKNRISSTLSLSRGRLGMRDNRLIIAGIRICLDQGDLRGMLKFYNKMPLTEDSGDYCIPDAVQWTLDFCEKAIKSKEPREQDLTSLCEKFAESGRFYQAFQMYLCAYYILQKPGIIGKIIENFNKIDFSALSACSISRTFDNFKTLLEICVVPKNQEGLEVAKARVRPFIENKSANLLYRTLTLSINSLVIDRKKMEKEQKRKEEADRMGRELIDAEAAEKKKNTKNKQKKASKKLTQKREKNRRIFEENQAKETQGKPKAQKSNKRNKQRNASLKFLSEAREAFNKGDDDENTQRLLNTLEATVGADKKDICVHMYDLQACIWLREFNKSSIFKKNITLVEKAIEAIEKILELEPDKKMTRWFEDKIKNIQATLFTYRQYVAKKTAELWASRDKLINAGRFFAKPPGASDSPKTLLRRELLAILPRIDTLQEKFAVLINGPRLSPNSGKK